MQGVSEEIILDMKMSLNFDLLPLSGETRDKERFWSGDSWRLSRGAINYRWNSPKEEGFNYLSPTRRQILDMPIEEIKKLSPSEKYDLLMGRYDYPLKMEVDWLARAGFESWEGICHGWAGATLNHEEPVAKILENPDGVKIPFGVSDIKGILSYAYSKMLIGDGQAAGKRCDANEMGNENCDNDLSPLAFHAVLTNKLGLRGESFIADIDRFKEVWNHPLISFDSKVVSMRATKTGRVAVISTRLSYIDVVERNAWISLPDVISYMTVKYELELDRRGNMIGSKWISRERPDFLWTVTRPEEFSGYLSEVKTLLKK